MVRKRRKVAPAHRQCNAKQCRGTAERIWHYRFGLYAAPDFRKTVTSFQPEQGRDCRMKHYVRLADYQKQRRSVYFSRQELGQILDVYSRRVASGEWRDYAIDHDGQSASFSIFRHTHERPLFAILKYHHGPQRPAEYLLISGKQQLKRAATLEEVLAAFDRRLELVR